MGSGASTEHGEDLEQITAYLRASPLAIVMGDDTLRAFAQCFSLATVEAGEELEIAANETRDGYYLIGEGQLDVSVILPDKKKKTGYVSELLCSKRQGDLLWVPSVQSLAGEIASSKGPERTRRGSRKRNNSLFSLLQHHHHEQVEGSSLPIAAARRGSEDASKNALDSVLSGSATEGSKGCGPNEYMSNSSIAPHGNLGKIMKQLDLTTVTSPYGARVLQLDRIKFEQFEAREKTKSLKDVTQTPQIQNDAEEAGDPSKTSIASSTNFQLVRAMLTSNIQDYLKRISFLSTVPSSRLHMLAGMSQFEVFTPGDQVCHEGADGSKVYIVLFGQVRVYSNKSRDHLYGNIKSNELKRLNMGDHFGELSVIADIPRQATVEAMTPCLLISISRAPFRNVMKAVPDLGQQVESMIRVYMISSCLNQFWEGQTLTDSRRAELEFLLLPTCSLVEVPAETTLITQGQDAADFYFLYHGRAQVIKHESDPDAPDKKIYRQVGIVGSASYFGEISILTKNTCRATIVTLTRCMLLKVSAEDFLQVWCRVAGFLAEFRLRIFGTGASLRDVLSLEMTAQSFRQHLEKELAQESLRFCDEVSAYASRYNELTSEVKRATAGRIIKQYVEENSPFQVCEHVYFSLLGIKTDCSSVH